MTSLAQKLALGAGAILVAGVTIASVAVLSTESEAASCGGGAVGTEIGGDFSLLDNKGKRVTLADFRGQPALLFFGYTFCPDVCPTGLSIISDAMDILDEKELAVTPLFMTVDPERDTPEIMDDYISNFHGAMRGLTGTPDDIAAAAKAFRVYYAKAPDENFPGGYAMEHSSLTYLLDAEGKVNAFFKHGTPPEEMAEAVACRMNGKGESKGFFQSLFN